MAFFEPIEPPKKRRRRRRRRHDDEWRAPTTVLPTWLPAGFVLARSDEMVVAVRGIACYPTGIEFELAAVTPFEVGQDDLLDDMHDGLLHGGPAARHGAFRFGVLFADGRRATTDREWPRPSDATQPLLVSGGGGGGGGDWQASLWLTPLPPDGPLWLVCEWPSRGIEETRKRIDGGRLRRAAAKAKPLLD